MDRMQSKFEPLELIKRINQTYGLDLTVREQTVSKLPMFKAVLPSCHPEYGFSIALDYNDQNPGSLERSLFQDDEHYVRAGNIYVELGFTGSNVDHELERYDIIQLQFPKPLKIQNRVVLPSLSIKIMALGDYGIEYIRTEHARILGNMGWTKQTDKWLKEIPTEWFKR